MYICQSHKFSAGAARDIDNSVVHGVSLTLTISDIFLHRLCFQFLINCFMNVFYVPHQIGSIFEIACTRGFVVTFVKVLSNLALSSFIHE